MHEQLPNSIHRLRLTPHLLILHRLNQYRHPFSIPHPLCRILRANRPGFCKRQPRKYSLVVHSICQTALGSMDCLNSDCMHGISDVLRIVPTFHDVHVIEFLHLFWDVLCLQPWSWADFRDIAEDAENGHSLKVESFGHYGLSIFLLVSGHNDLGYLAHFHASVCDPCLQQPH